MSKMSNMAQTIEELRNAAVAITDAANWLTRRFSGEDTTNPVILIEQRVDFSHWVEQDFGTSDAILIADNTMHVIDY